MTPEEGASTLRQAVAALSSRMAVELGDLVPAASVERTAALVGKLERLPGTSDAGRTAAPAPRFDQADVETLDSWIRVADSATLHDDPAEAQVRTEIAGRLRALRALVTPDSAWLTDDPRES